MTVSSVATGYDGISLLAGNTYYDPAATFFIQRITATGGETTLSFTSIPSTYKHLQIRGVSRDNAASSGLRIRLNNDSGSSYSWHRIYGDGSSTYAGASFSTSIIFLSSWVGNGSNSNMFTATLIDIHDYASSTKNKVIRAINGSDTNNTGGNDNIALTSGTRYNTEAVTSVNIDFPVGAIAGSTFALYGMVG